MPQGGGRCKGGGKGQAHGGKAFSGQKKKVLLQKKRAAKRDDGDEQAEDLVDDDPHRDATEELDGTKPKVVTSFGGNADSEGARLSSFFAREDDATVAARRARGTEPLVEHSEQGRLVAEHFVPLQPTEETDSAKSDFSRMLPHPVRPRWDKGTTASELESQEEAYFKDWCGKTSASIEALGPADVAPFELNLEVWRQLWRVTEQSDVVALIADVRNPTMHIPPSLVHNIVEVQRKGCVVVLNKCDLVSQAYVSRWKRYLTAKLPSSVGVFEFMSRPVGDELPGGERGAGGVGARRRWIGRRVRQNELEAHSRAIAKGLLQCALDHCAAWREGQRSKDSQAEDDTAEGLSSSSESLGTESAGDGERHMQSGHGPGGAFALGLLGHPNVGKTSVLNALAGRKAASVSGTAGHTKHLQHIRVDEAVHENAFVLDCPGLVFPSVNSRAHAELHGLLPLAQVRETMSAIRTIAEALPLPKIFGLKIPDWYDDDEPWTPLSVVEAYCEKHRYFIPRSGAPDVHRGGLELLKDTKDGALLLGL